MNVEAISKLFEVVRKRNTLNFKNDWSHSSSTYIDGMRKELVEVEEELSLDRLCYLEDELGDVLWDYMCTLVCLEEEKGINIESVFERALQKYDERVSGIETGVWWNETKTKQKKQLLEEWHASLAEK